MIISCLLAPHVSPVGVYFHTLNRIHVGHSPCSGVGRVSVQCGIPRPFSFHSAVFRVYHFV